MGLEQAREQMNESLNQETSSQSALPQESISQDGGQKTAEEKLLELDSVQKFKFNGKEWDPKELQKSIMLHSDYTKKTQSLAQERQRLAEEQKFDLNLRYDLENVLRDPSLASEFKKLYPKEYHTLLDTYLQKAGLADQEKPVNQVPPEIANRLATIEQQLHEKDVEKNIAEIDATIEKLSKEYPRADIELVISRVKALSDQGHKITSDAWKEVFKWSENRNLEAYKKYYSDEFKKQKEASQSAKDIQPGGGVPGQAPVVPKNLKEAREAAIAALSGKRF